MAQTYTIANRVWGVHGGRAYDYAAGKVTPSGAAERRLLDHLVSIGRAAAPVAGTKKKGA